MKRDIDLIRMLLLTTEENERQPGLADYDNRTIAGHIALMLDAGLIEGHVADDERGEPMGGIITRLTWAGHDFLDASRDPTVWEKAKEKVLRPGVSWTVSLLVEILKDEAKRRLGLG